MVSVSLDSLSTSPGTVPGYPIVIEVPTAWLTHEVQEGYFAVTADANKNRQITYRGKKVLLFRVAPLHGYTVKAYNREHQHIQICFREEDKKLAVHCRMHIEARKPE